MMFGNKKGGRPEVKKQMTNEDFWNWFVTKADRFYNIVKTNGNTSADFINPVSGKLNELRSGYFLLTGMYGEDEAELIITADGDVRVIPFIEQLVSEAPEIPNWRITALKPPSELDDFSVNFSHASLSAETLHFVFKENKNYPDLIDIDIVHDDITDATRHLFEQGIFIFLENYIGELQSLEYIDDIEIKATYQSKGELIPISKLFSFLNWRRKEFVEKYDSVIHTTDQDVYTGYESRTKQGKTLIATLNTYLINWEHSAAYPWITVVRLSYKGSNGMPTEVQIQQMEVLEEKISAELNEKVFCLNVGRETGDNLREIYYACKNFRTPAVALDAIADSDTAFNMKFEIRKDKYWMAFDRFR